MAKTALVTGITGQDGALLTAFLLQKGYIVHGIKRRSSILKTDRIDHLYEDPHNTDTRLFLHYGDLSDSTNVIRIIQDTRPDEIYNLAAQSHVAVSFESPEYTANVDALGTLRVLEAVRLLRLAEVTRVYQASTSEMFGKVQEIPQRETTPFYPRSPYGVAKVYAYWITRNYREAYGLFACNGILFNHESPIRGETFVTRKITIAVAKIANDLLGKLYLGNLDAKRDWGHARDYIEAMYLILQQNQPEDYVIATGSTTTVRDFVALAFAQVGIQLDFVGKGSEEKGIIRHIDKARFAVKVGRDPSHLKVGQTVVAVDPCYFRPTEVDILIGDATKAREKLGWQPRTTLAELVQEMVTADMGHLAHRPRR